MRNLLARLGTSARALWDGILQVDNHLIGLVICVFAVLDWLAVYDGIEPLQIYVSQGIYTVPSLGVLNTLFSAIYLTLAAIILLSLRQPLSRYRSVWPNLVAVLAAFGLYAFVVIPTGTFLRVNVAVSLLLIVIGSIVVITALIYLRQAFSVTPQARFLVTAGPYAIVRHPMYVGNILSILGVALLIDSVEAIALFVICAALQLGRAFYEERLLREAFPDYANYQARVGRFFPRLPLRLAAQTALVLGAVLLTLPPAQAQRADAGVGDLLLTQVSSPDRPLVLIAANATTRKCTAWSRKALSGEIFNERELTDMERTSIGLDLDKLAEGDACKRFYEMKWACEAISGEQRSVDLSDDAFLQKIGAAPGCPALVANDVCQALKNTARKGIRLPDTWQAFMAGCARIEVISRRFEQMRPGM
jgi:protein-S-isoprenylcysteine O-methyltransferase Ste14